MTLVAYTARRAASAVPGEARGRRGHPAGRSPPPERDRRRVPRRGHRRVRPLGRADLLHGLGRRAGARGPPHPALRPSPASLARLLRAEPHGRDRQPNHERRRGARPARHGRHLEPRPELARPRGTVVVLFLLDWRLALATLVVLPLMGLATAWFRSRSNRAYRRVRERLGLVTATLAEDISGMRVVQSFTREPTSQTTFRGVNERYREANYETVILNGLYFPAVDILSSVATAIVLGVGGWLVVEGNMTIGTLLAFTLYLANFFDPVQQLSQLYNTFLSATAALDRITNVLDEEPEIVDAPGRPRRCRGSAGTSASSTSASGTASLPGRPPRLRPRRAGRHHGRARRPHGRGEVDDREAPRPLLRPARGPDHDRRPRPSRGDAGVAPPAARHRPAGGLPLRRLDRGQHRFRRARRRRVRRSRAAAAAVGADASSPSFRTATTPRSASAGSGSRSASASSSRSRARCSPIRGS